jgi:hypothetical protein
LPIEFKQIASAKEAGKAGDGEGGPKDKKALVSVELLAPSK